MAVTEFDELNELFYDYKYSDRLMKSLARRTMEEFANCKLLTRTVLMSPKRTITHARKMYDRMWKDCKSTLLRIGKHYWSEVDDEWLYLFLTDYDPVFRVVYENEQDRKRARFVEGVLSSDKVYDKNEYIDRSMRLWLRMINEMGIEVTDKASVDKYKAKGIKKVMWVTEEDEKVCAECHSMNRNIYDIDNVPPKPHINCRCMLYPVKG